MRFIKHLLIIVICVFGVVHTNTSFAGAGAAEGGESGGGETVQCNPGEMENSDGGCECKGDMHKEEGTCKITCGAGPYLQSGGTECVSCASETVNLNANQYCPGGEQFMYNEENKQGIENCEDGSYVDINRTKCTRCEKGFACKDGTKTQCIGSTYSDKNGLANCETCAEDSALFWDDEGLNIACKKCEPGEYAFLDENKEAQCKKCEAGYFCTDNKKSKCPNGQRSDEASSSCETCSDGTYAKDNECIVCPAGSYCINGEQKVCPDRTISRNTGWDTCVSCSDAGFVANDARTECVPQFINGETTWKFPDFMKIIR